MTIARHPAVTSDDGVSVQDASRPVAGSNGRHAGDLVRQVGAWQNAVALDGREVR